MPIRKRANIKTSGPGLSFDRPKEQIERKATQFVAAVISGGSVRARKKAPVEYSNLVNSMFTSTFQYRGKVSGRVGFGVNYAKYLNGLPGYKTPTWSPRPVSEKDGPGANMNAEPGFLDKAFESDEAQADIRSLQNIFKV